MTGEQLETWEWKWIVLPADSSLPSGSVMSMGYVAHHQQTTASRQDSTVQARADTAHVKAALEQHNNGVRTETEHPPERRHYYWVFIVGGFVAALSIMYLIKKKT